jgi:hypothetical protein
VNLVLERVKLARRPRALISRRHLVSRAGEGLPSSPVTF